MSVTGAYYFLKVSSSRERLPVIGSVVKLRHFLPCGCLLVTSWVSDLTLPENEKIIMFGLNGALVMPISALHRKWLSLENRLEAGGGGGNRENGGMLEESSKLTGSCWTQIQTGRQVRSRYWDQAQPGSCWATQFTGMLVSTVHRNAGQHSQMRSRVSSDSFWFFFRRFSHLSTCTVYACLYLARRDIHIHRAPASFLTCICSPAALHLRSVQNHLRTVTPAFLGAGRPLADNPAQASTYVSASTIDTILTRSEPLSFSSRELQVRK